VVEDEELPNRLIEIDENLKRLDLTVWEQSKHADERERVLGALNQRAKPEHGKAKSLAPVTVTGAKTTQELANETPYNPGPDEPSLQHVKPVLDSSRRREGSTPVPTNRPCNPRFASILRTPSRS
jgi:hypothetical protein